MNAKSVMVRKLDDEYEINQLVPIYSKNDGRKKDTDPSQEQIEKLDDKLPATAATKMRMAILEAIVDQVVQDEVADAVEKGEYPDEDQIQDKVAPIVEGAEAIHMIPPFPQRRLNELIAKHLRVHDPLYSLVDKAAHFCAGAMSSVMEDAVTASELTPQDLDTVPADIEKSDEYGGPDTSPADTGVNINVEVVKPEDSEITVDEDVPEKQATAMRYLTASAINHRKATAIMSHRISGALLADTLYQLRYRLPESFKRKYRLHY